MLNIKIIARIEKVKLHNIGKKWKVFSDINPRIRRIENTLDE